MAPFIRRKQENQSVATVFISTLVLLLPDDVRRDAPDVFYRLAAAAGVTAGHRHMYIVDGMSQWIVGSMKSDCGPKVYKNTRK